MSDATIRGGAGDDAVRTAGLGDYIELLKPRVMSLVTFSGLAGMIAAPGDIHPVIAFTAILCIAVAAGASGAINMWYDRDIDALMQRTRGRPIPDGRVDAGEALAFGVVLSVAAVVLMGLAVNWVAGTILGLASAFYVFVYTVWLKRRTPQNIVIGGAAGAFPPMIGWAAVTGDVTLAPIVLFLLIFMWTPPHFWALALFRNGDYQRAGVPMLPVVAGERETKRQMLVYTLLLMPIAVTPWFLGIAGTAYLAGAVVLSVLFVVCAVRVWFEPGGRDASYRAAKQMFAFSILHLFLLFALLIADNLA